MVQQQEMIDLGIVFKASTVVEAIEAFLRARNVAPVISTSTTQPLGESV
jgi:hypothetical protein